MYLLKSSYQTIMSSASSKKAIIGNVSEISISNVYNFVSKSSQLEVNFQ